MLTYDLTELDELKQRAIQASTLVAQPFWRELQTCMYAMIDERLMALEQSKDSSDTTKARLLDRYVWTKEIVARIERIPQSAIEAMREPGEE